MRGVWLGISQFRVRIWNTWRCDKAGLISDYITVFPPKLGGYLCNILHFTIFIWSCLIAFLAVQNSSMQCTHSWYFYFWHIKSDPRDPWPLRHFSESWGNMLTFCVKGFTFFWFFFLPILPIFYIFVLLIILTIFYRFYHFRQCWQFLKIGN